MASMHGNNMWCSTGQYIRTTYFPAFYKIIHLLLSPTAFSYCRFIMQWIKFHVKMDFFFQKSRFQKFQYLLLYFRNVPFEVPKNAKFNLRPYALRRHKRYSVMLHCTAAMLKGISHFVVQADLAFFKCRGTLSTFRLQL